MQKALLAIGAATALVAQPLAAQDTAPPEEDFAPFAAMFKVEPLTAEQEARLPAARAIVARIMPPGTLDEIMGSMFDGLLGPMTQMEVANPAAAAAQHLGLETDDLELEEEAAAEAAAIIDPAWLERREREAAFVPDMMSQLMKAMEPAMNRAMTELYAIYFDDRQLADIEAFFSTPSGLAYARESMRMSSDPRLMGMVMSEVPNVMGIMMRAGEEVDAATADLPEPRSYADLDARQRDRLAELTGLTQGELAAAMADAAAPE